MFATDSEKRRRQKKKIPRRRDKEPEKRKKTFSPLIVEIIGRNCGPGEHGGSRGSIEKQGGGLSRLFPEIWNRIFLERRLVQGRVQTTHARSTYVRVDRSDIYEDSGRTEDDPHLARH